MFAVTMVKDESDIIASTVLNLLGWGVEQVIVADNGSTDSTRALLDNLAAGSCQGSLTVIDDPIPGYYQAKKMTGLLRKAERAGAEWVIPFDADELWAPSAGHVSIPEELATIPGWAVWGSVPMWNHYPTCHDDPGTTDPVDRILWRAEERNPLDKVVVRAGQNLSLDMGNHRVLFPGDWAPGPEVLQIRHFPYRTADQFVRKSRNGAAAYAATNLDDTYGAHWRGYGRILDDPDQGETALREVFWEHFFYTDVEHLVHDPAPLPPGLWLA